MGLALHTQGDETTESRFRQHSQALQRLCMVRSRPSAIDDVHRTARGRHPTQVVGESSSWWSSWGRSFCSPCSSVVPAMEASVRTASGEEPAGVCQDSVYGVVATSVFF